MKLSALLAAAALALACPPTCRPHHPRQGPPQQWPRVTCGSSRHSWWRCSRPGALTRSAIGADCITDSKEVSRKGPKTDGRGAFEGESNSGW